MNTTQYMNQLFFLHTLFFAKQIYSKNPPEKNKENVYRGALLFIIIYRLHSNFSHSRAQAICLVRDIEQYLTLNVFH